MSGPTINRAESSGDIWTPWAFIRAVEKKFGPLTVDLAASGSQSAKAERWITPEADSLKQDWVEIVGRGLGWDNCPYSNITPWAKKHADSWQRNARTLLLVPASIGANWYWNYVEPFATVYSVGRMVFDNCYSRKTGELITTSYPKDLILCHYGEYPSSGLKRWRWELEDPSHVEEHLESSL